MNLKIFDTKIIVPTKCGTRYCEQIFPTYVHGWDWNWYHDNQILTESYWMIYRHPMEHLISALQTEMLMVFNGLDTISMEGVLDKFISTGGTTHYSNQICQDIYLHWERNPIYFHPIELGDLTKTLQTLGYPTIEFDASDYSFSNLPIVRTKEECLFFLKLHYPQYWNTLLSYVEKDIPYYQKLQEQCK